MKSVYSLCGLSRQAHHRACVRQLRQLDKEVVYIRLMEQAREIHPGMGLRTMYGMLEPEGIGRDAFVALGLREGFRLRRRVAVEHGRARHVDLVGWLMPARTCRAGPAASRTASSHAPRGRLRDARPRTRSTG